ncbi:unnamed protein product [Linum tenue]|uniref:Uncharacterized protein n=1 Tax=Linum tenue TaxID=586396 RepID=A0AAV0IUN6_9ROSI|nr:unnamed protein product [Linum tenue]
MSRSGTPAIAPHSSPPTNA